MDSLPVHPVVGTLDIKVNRHAVAGGILPVHRGIDRQGVKPTPDAQVDRNPFLVVLVDVVVGGPAAVFAC